MRVLINREALESNIEKAKTLSQGVPVSLLFKDFYEDIFAEISPDVRDVFSMNIEGSNCYAIGKATGKHKGAVITSLEQMRDDLMLERVYIPINAHDNREGLTIADAKILAQMIKSIGPYEVVGMVTSGCLNERAPKMEEIYAIWEELKGCISSLSIGGSYWLGREEKLPNFIREIRIGEYMLFGTIPYNNDWMKLGQNAITIEAEVIGVYPERNHIMIDCGYSMAEPDKFDYASGLFYVDSSSEYTILYTTDDYKVGDKMLIKPNYKSLVKLKHAVRDYI